MSSTAKVAISSLRPRLVLNSAAQDTIEVEVRLSDGTVASAASPQGTTVGRHDAPFVSPTSALELAVELGSTLTGIPANDQEKVDATIAATLGAANGRINAANLACASSMAVATSAALSQQIPLWKHIASVYGTAPKMPGIAVNVLGGGAHNATGMPITESLLISPASHPYQMISRVRSAFEWLSGFVEREYGAVAFVSGLEGGLVAPVKNCARAYQLLEAAIMSTDDNSCLIPLKIGFDMAGNSLIRGDNAHRTYDLDAGILTVPELIHTYARWQHDWPFLTYLEDPFADDVFQPWTDLLACTGAESDMRVIADDLVSSDTARLDQVCDFRAAHSVIAKIDQCGTLSLLAEFAKSAQARDLSVVVSQRSRETDSPFIADLAVGLGADLLKAGCCSRERIIKYNRLIRIGDELDITAVA